MEFAILKTVGVVEGGGEVEVEVVLIFDFRHPGATWFDAKNIWELDFSVSTGASIDWPIGHNRPCFFCFRSVFRPQLDWFGIRPATPSRRKNVPVEFMVVNMFIIWSGWKPNLCWRFCLMVFMIFLAWKQLCNMFHGDLIASTTFVAGCQPLSLTPRNCSAWISCHAKKERCSPALRTRMSWESCC